MNAMAMNRYGGPEVLELVQLPLPQAAAGEVRVKVHAMSINPVDTQWRKKGPYGMTNPVFPMVLGWDISGVVDQVGAGVTEFQVGDEVFGMVGFPALPGGYAEFVLAPVADLARKPANLSHVEAAALTLAALTALQVLKRLALTAGQTVLIHAGAGGVGHFAVQLAKARGLRVLATASEKNFDFVKGLGADQVIDYRAQPFEQQVSGVDAVFDTVGRDTFTRSFGVVRPGGWVIGIVTVMTDELKVQAHQAGIQADWNSVVRSQPDLQELARLAEAGQVRPHISQMFTLEEMAEAHRAQESGRTVGKIVLTVD